MRPLANGGKKIVRLTAALLCAFASLSAHAQCAMCYATLATSGNSKLIHTFKIAILSMLIPTLGIFVFLTIMTIRHRNMNSAWDAASGQEPGWDDPLFPESSLPQASPRPDPAPSRL